MDPLGWPRAQAAVARSHEPFVPATLSLLHCIIHVVARSTVGYRRSLLCWTVSVSVNGPRPLAGKREAVKAGDALKQHNFQFDVAYTSVLSRAIRTLWLALEAVDQVWPGSPSVVVMSDTRCCKTRVRDRGVPWPTVVHCATQVWIPVIRDYRLNERHYGGLTGLNKAETAKKHGEEKVMLWRRSYDVPPPPMSTSDPYWPGNDRRYKDVPKNLLPLTESLKTTGDRCVTTPLQCCCVVVSCRWRSKFLRTVVVVGCSSSVSLFSCCVHLVVVVSPFLLLSCCVHLAVPV